MYLIQQKERSDYSTGFRKAHFRKLTEESYGQVVESFECHFFNLMTALSCSSKSPNLLDL